MNNQLLKDIVKGIKQEPINQTLPAGSTPRRYEPEVGVRRHNERIHRESKYADEFKNLPFKFSKPPKPRGTSTYIVCDSCGYITNGTSVTVGIICPECKKFSTVSEVELDG